MPIPLLSQRPRPRTHFPCRGEEGGAGFPVTPTGTTLHRLAAGSGRVRLEGQISSVWPGGNLVEELVPQGRRVLRQQQAVGRDQLLFLSQGGRGQLAAAQQPATPAEARPRPGMSRVMEEMDREKCPGFLTLLSSKMPLVPR